MMSSEGERMSVKRTRAAERESKRVRWDTRSEETHEQDEGKMQDAWMMVMGSMKKEKEERKERIRVASNMGGGSYSQATTDPDEKEAQENQRAMKWADGVGIAKGGRSPR